MITKLFKQDTSLQLAFFLEENFFERKTFENAGILIRNHLLSQKTEEKNYIYKIWDKKPPCLRENLDT